MSIIASMEGYNKEQLLVHAVDDGHIYMTVVRQGERREEVEAKWYEVLYEIEEDGTFNQSLKGVMLPYIVHDNNVYSLDDFHDWRG